MNAGLGRERAVIAGVLLACSAAKAQPRDEHEPSPSVPASWSSAPAATASPSCVVAADRFIQYAELDQSGGLRICLWWNLRKQPPDAGCWRVDLVAGTYAGERGVWFSAPVPNPVGVGGGAAGLSASLQQRWEGDRLEICRQAACKRFALARPRGDDEVVFDAEGSLAVVPLGRPPGKAKTHAFATLDLTTGKQVATLSIPDQHEGAVTPGFLGPSLVVTDCDERATACAWDLYDPRTGVRLGAVGGARRLGAGGTVAMVDGRHFAAVAGTHLVVQESATGKVTAELELERVKKVNASYVVLMGALELVLPGPDGRVLLVDPLAGKVTRTLVPPACGTHLSPK